MAVKKAVADQFIPDRNWNLENHTQLPHIRECIEAARRNLRLGRWIRGGATFSRKLLTSNLHNIFNAATILLLNQLLFDGVDPSQDQDAHDVWFAINCFEVEQQGGSNNYAIDCTSVLKDLEALVKRLRTQTIESRNQVRGTQVQLPGTTAYDVGFILNHEVTPNILPSPHHLSYTVYNQLSGWMEQGDFQMYNDAAFIL